MPLRVLPTDAVLRAHADGLRALLGPGGELDARMERDQSGPVLNLMPDEHPVLAGFASSLAELAELPEDARLTFRYRSYGVGFGHRGHQDHYRDGDEHLVATFALSLSDRLHGGETVFPHAPGGPLAAGHVRGQVLWWDALDAGGRPVDTTWHEAREVRAGTKEVLLAFAWRREPCAWLPSASQVLTAAAAEADQEVGTSAVAIAPSGIREDVFPIPVPGDGLAAEDCPGVFCIRDRAPMASVRALRVAAEHRGVAFFVLQVGSLDLWHREALPSGSLLLQVSASEAATRALERLWHPGVASLHDGELGPLSVRPAQARVLECAGVPVPRWAPLVRSDREGLDRMAEALGGYPLVVQFTGGSGGVGTVRVDSPAAFHSLAQYARYRGQVPDVKRYLRATATWRVAVVDGRAAGACRLRVPEGDFRTVVDDQDEAWLLPPEHVASLAIRATDALGLVAAGVDVLVDENGRGWVLEANCPFYFGHHQERGQDVAGAIVEALLRRAAQILAA